jgi:hypothetical protein
MLKNAALVALATVLFCAPVAYCQEDSFNSTADTGESGEMHESSPTNTQTAPAPPQAGLPYAGFAVPGKTQTTGTQGVRGRLPNLPAVVTGMPAPGSDGYAPGSLALQNEGKTHLEKTSTAILSETSIGPDGAAVRTIKPGLEKVIGDEGATIQKFKKENTIDTILPKGLTTGHPNAAPPASEGY